MNKETEKIVKFIEESRYKDDLGKLRLEHSNYKDFFNQSGYVIQNILNTEKQFFDYPRHKIDLNKIVELYF